MSKSTGVFKRCSCTEAVLDRDGQTVLDRSGKPKTRELGSGCPRLAGGKHGYWDSSKRL